ncbi:MAG: hypothetical protein K5989_04875 [Lachnospiraceae bacterium]|nr:hypothetical protein [Lachnospiraceae bacterium]
MIGTVLALTALASSVYGTIMGMIRNGIFTFTYFTTLSNVMVSISTLIWLLVRWQKRESLGFRGEHFFMAFHFVTAISISVTFLVYLLILAPTHRDGFIGAYQYNHYASTAAHLISPITSMLHYIYFDRKIIAKKYLTICSLSFPLAYLFYTLGLGKLGVRWGSKIMPYNFLNFDAACGWFGFRPDTIGSDSLGIGVAYVIVFLFFFFLLIGKGIFAWKSKSLRRV